VQAERIVDLLAVGLQLKAGGKSSGSAQPANRCLLRDRHVYTAPCGTGSTRARPRAEPEFRAPGEKQCSLRNGLAGSANFEACNVGGQLPQLLIQAEPQGVNLVVDSPRRGLDSALCSAIATPRPPRRFACLSCSPTTLARDLRRICEAGTLRIELVQPIDFPQTTHAECLVLLTPVCGH